MRYANRFDFKLLDHSRPIPGGWLKVAVLWFVHMFSRLGFHSRTARFFLDKTDGSSSLRVDVGILSASEARRHSVTQVGKHAIELLLPLSGAWGKVVSGNGNAERFNGWSIRLHSVVPERQSVFIQVRHRDPSRRVIESVVMDVRDVITLFENLETHEFFVSLGTAMSELQHEDARLRESVKNVHRKLTAAKRALRALDATASSPIESRQLIVQSLQAKNTLAVLEELIAEVGQSTRMKDHVEVLDVLIPVVEFLAWHFVRDPYKGPMYNQLFAAMCVRFSEAKSRSSARHVRAA